MDPFKFDIIVTPSGTCSSSYSAQLINEYSDDPGVVFIKVGWAPHWTPMGGGDGPKQLISVHDAFSGHADISGLLAYVQAFPELTRVIITHGDDEIGARDGLAEGIAGLLPQVEIVIPSQGEEISLLD